MEVMIILFLVILACRRGPVQREDTPEQVDYRNSYSRRSSPRARIPLSRESGSQPW